LRVERKVHFMSFADNLRELRKEKHLTQEELAELLGVSRQSVSKWEQGIGYPEVETLLLLSEKMNISLDCLMDVKLGKENQTSNAKVTGKLTIVSPNENVITSCYKVASSGKMYGGKKSPHYALFGVGSGSTQWGETTTFLGWYADKEQITKEIGAIQHAIENGIPTYELQYSAKTERKWNGLKIVEE